jgi:hypothetical protein
LRCDYIRESSVILPQPLPLLLLAAAARLAMPPRSAAKMKPKMCCFCSEADTSLVFFESL